MPAEHYDFLECVFFFEFCASADLGMGNCRTENQDEQQYILIDVFHNWLFGLDAGGRLEVDGNHELVVEQGFLDESSAFGVFQLEGKNLFFPRLDEVGRWR